MIIRTLLILLLPSLLHAAEQGQSVSYTRADTDGVDYTITFNFTCGGGDCLYGQFANGWDYWVAPLTPTGDITITEMLPAATGSGDTYRDGAMFGPTNMAALQGWNGNPAADASFRAYDATKSLVTPFVHNPSAYGRPEVILKSISEEELCTTSERMCNKYVETLTLLSEDPGDVFRPSYYGTVKTMFSASSFDTSFLSNYAPTPSSISWDTAADTLRSVHPQHFVANNNSRQGYNPKINTQTVDGYDGYYGNALGPAILKLTEAVTGGDVALKDEVARGVAQLGIDLWAIHLEGGNEDPTTDLHIRTSSVPCGAWIARGGFNNSRLTPILFANALLGQDWVTPLDATLSTLNGKNCFAETGFIQPAGADPLGVVGKNVPLFGNIIGNLGLYTYTYGGPDQNCNLIAPSFGVDGGYPDSLIDRESGCGIPTAYQHCCTHGNWLGAALAIWLTPQVFNSVPPNAMHWLDYVQRSKTQGDQLGFEFGAYSDPSPTDFSFLGFDTGYDKPVYYEMWDAYKGDIPEGPPEPEPELEVFSDETSIITGG